MCTLDGQYFCVICGYAGINEGYFCMDDQYCISSVQWYMYDMISKIINCSYIYIDYRHTNTTPTNSSSFWLIKSSRTFSSSNILSLETNGKHG